MKNDQEPVDLTAFRTANVIEDLGMYGYSVFHKPAAGEEVGYLDALSDAFKKVHGSAGLIAKRMGYTNRRGPVVLSAFHAELPEPAAGVRVLPDRQPAL